MISSLIKSKTDKHQHIVKYNTLNSTVSRKILLQTSKELLVSFVEQMHHFYCITYFVKVIYYHSFL